MSEGIPMPVYLDKLIVPEDTFPVGERLSLCVADRVMSTDIWVAPI